MSTDPVTVSLVLLAVLAVSTLFPLLVGNVRNALAVLVAASAMNGLTITVGPAGLRVEAFAVLAVAVAAVLDTRNRPVPVLSRIGLVPLLALGMWLALSLVSSVTVAPEPARSLFMLLNLVLGVLVFVQVSMYPVLHRDLVVWGTGVLAVLSAASLVSLLLGWDASPLVAGAQAGDLPRVRGLTLEPNIMGGLLAAWLGVMFYWRACLTFVLRLLAVPIAAALVFTNTRAAWVALAVVVVFWVVTKQGRLYRSPHLIPLYLLGAVLLVSRSAGVATVENSLVWKLQNVFDFSSGNGRYRIETWLVALEDLRSLRDWMFGLGVNSYSQRHPQDLTGVTEGYLGNLWLGWMYDSGVLGLLAFVAFGVVTFLRNPDRLASTPTYLALAVCSTSTNGFWMVFPWLMLALVAHPPVVASAEGPAAAVASSPEPRTTSRTSGAPPLPAHADLSS